MADTGAKEKIKERLDLVDIISEVVSLKPAGHDRFKGLCPFHDEKTPSFHVSRDKGFYYCFGCHAKGDVFDFVMQTQHVDFMEAMQVLGRRAGVEVAPPTEQEKAQRNLLDVNMLALEYFVHNLKNHPIAQEYLEQRQLTTASIDTFSLGYAPDGWDGLLKHLQSVDVSIEQMKDVGLLSSSESGRIYDRFRHRIMFPIQDYMGRVVGFSGRVLDDSLPKYVNTPETSLFDKGTLLYGLHIAKTPIRESKACIVVEGYMDVIALHQVGIGNVVAALGATLTEAQAQQLSRLDVNAVYLAFDADEAGQRAVLSGLDQSVGRDFLVKAVQVPRGKDPAEAVLSGHVVEFQAALEEGLSEVDFRFERALSQFDVKTVEGKRDMLNELLPVLKPRRMFDPVATEMRRLVIDTLELDAQRFDTWLNGQRTPKLNTTQVQGLRQAEQAAPSRLALIELDVIALLLLEPHKLSTRLEQLRASLPQEPNIVSLLPEFCTVCVECNYVEAEILRHYQNQPEGSIVFEKFFQHSQAMQDAIDIDGHVTKSLSRLREMYLEQEKETQRKHLLARMEEVGQYLTDSSLPADKLVQYYSELKEIQAMLLARDAERRLRVPEHLSKKKY